MYACHTFFLFFPGIEWLGIWIICYEIIIFQTEYAQNNMADGSRKSLMPFVHNGEQFCTLPNWILAMCEITRHCLNTNGIRKIFLELVGHNRRTGSQFRHKNNYLYKVLMFLYLYLLMNLSYTIDIEIRWRFDNISINLLSKSNRGGYIGGNIVQITFSE